MSFRNFVTHVSRTWASLRQRRFWPLVLTFLLFWFLLAAPSPAGQLPGNRWDLLAIVYPPDLNLLVELGGGEKTLRSKGTCKVRAKKEAASVDIEVKDL